MNETMNYFMVNFLPIVAIFALFWFLLIRPQKKREKQNEQMRSTLQIADEIMTSGGIIGRIVSMKEDTLVIETGSDRSKIRIARWAVAQNLTAMENSSK